MVLHSVKSELDIINLPTVNMLPSDSMFSRGRSSGCSLLGNLVGQRCGKERSILTFASSLGRGGGLYKTDEIGPAPRPSVTKELPKCSEENSLGGGQFRFRQPRFRRSSLAPKRLHGGRRGRSPRQRVYENFGYHSGFPPPKFIRKK